MPKLTVFLYEIAEDPTSRNRPPVRSLPPDAPTTRKPPMALLLRYLITPWGGDQLTQHRMIGRALQAFYDDAILDGEELTGSLAASTGHPARHPDPADAGPEVVGLVRDPEALPAVAELRDPRREPGLPRRVGPAAGRSRTINGAPVP